MTQNDDNASESADEEPGVDADDSNSDNEFDLDQELNQIWTKYESELKDLDGGQGTRKAIEMIEKMSTVQAEAEVNSKERGDRIEIIVKGYINQIADRKSYLTRTSLKEIWGEELNRAKSEATVEGDLPDEFDEFIAETLDSVEKKITRDSDSSEAEYSLSFDDGRETTFSVPRGTLFSEKKFWEAYTSASGQYPLRPGMDDDEWANSIGPIIEELEKTTWEDGPRTAAFHQLENLVATSAAYSSLQDAVERGGVYVDDEPPNHTEVWVLREDIARIRQTNDITDRALQIEIVANDAHAAAARNDPNDKDSTGGGRSVSYSTHVNGLWQTFWQLNADSFDDPKSFIEDPEDRTDREDAAIDAATETQSGDVDNKRSSSSEKDEGTSEDAATHATDEDNQCDDSDDRNGGDQSEDDTGTHPETDARNGDGNNRADKSNDESSDGYGITGRYGPSGKDEDHNGDGSNE